MMQSRYSAEARVTLRCQEGSDLRRQDLNVKVILTANAIRVGDAKVRRVWWVSRDGVISCRSISPYSLYLVFSVLGYLVA